VNAQTNGHVTPTMAAALNAHVPPVTVGEAPPRVPLHDYSLDDRGNGQRFVAVWGNRVAWTAEAKTMRLYSGAIWETDTGSGMRHLAELVTDMMLDEVAMLRTAAALRLAALEAAGTDTGPEYDQATSDMARAVAYGKWTAASRMDARYKAMITSAQSCPEISVRAGLWDADPRLLSLGNGVVHLGYRGEITFRPHQWSDRLTQQASVCYDPAALCPEFDAYLAQVQPDPALRRVLLALVGASLVGRNERHLLPVLIGASRSGKSAFVKIVYGVLANATAPKSGLSATFDLAMMRPAAGGGPNPALYRIMNRRFIYCSEGSGGITLSGDLVKRFTGGDHQGARDAYGKAEAIEEREPAFSPWLAVNEAPQVDRADNALRERIVAVPFTHPVPPAERELGLAERLVATEGPGILNAFLKGYADLMADAAVLRDLPAACVTTANRMFGDMDIYQRWLAECTEKTDDATRWITVAESWAMFNFWARESNETAGTKRAFGNAMMEAGHGWVDQRHPTLDKNLKYRKGIGWSVDHLAELDDIDAMATGISNA